jgi:Fe-S cluster assembly iron-binding protein IscA
LKLKESNLSVKTTFESKPLLTISAFALSQIFLIQENDFTIADLSFRIKIGGKECDGFRYSTGFSAKDSEDETHLFNYEGKDIVILMDPFTSFYLMEGHVDFQMDPDTQDDGFVIVNNNEKKHFGKFFKNTDLTPEHLLKK